MRASSSSLVGSDMGAPEGTWSHRVGGFRQLGAGDGRAEAQHGAPVDNAHDKHLGAKSARGHRASQTSDWGCKSNPGGPRTSKTLGLVGPAWWFNCLPRLLPGIMLV